MSPHRSRGGRRALVALGLTVALLALAAADVVAAGTPYLPLVLSGARPAPPGPVAPTPPPVALSTLLARTPLPDGAVLVFFEQRPTTAPPTAHAVYRVPGVDIGTLRSWYGDILFAYGWRRDAADPSGERWVWGRGFLRLQLEATDNGVRLRVTRDLRAVRPGRDAALDGWLALPEGAALLRLDAADLLTEEYRLSGAPGAMRAWLDVALAELGYAPDGRVADGPAIVVRYRGPGAPLLAALRPLPDGTELALGRAACLPPADGDAVPTLDGSSVYLEGVPAPPGLSIAGYRRPAGAEVAREMWRRACADLDLMRLRLETRLMEAGWGRDMAARRPGALELTMTPPDGGPPLGVSAGPTGTLSAGLPITRGVAVTLTRDAIVRRLPGHRSLLYPDIPLPAGADALALEVGRPAGWTHRERYAVPEGPLELRRAWYRDQLPAAGWTFDRSEPPPDGADQVYAKDGAELWLRLSAAPPTLTLVRRQVCADGDPQPPDGAPGRARQLRDMPVFPGAHFNGFTDDEERYALTCAGLTLIADWYREAMPADDWAHTATVGPDDPLARTLVFARPEERSLPPEERTAWAEVTIERPWPYHYRLRLRRDPRGVVDPLDGARVPRRAVR